MSKSKKNSTYSNKQLRDLLKSSIDNHLVMEVMEGFMNDDDVYERAIDILMDFGYDYEAGPSEEEIKENDKAMLLGARLYKYGKSDKAKKYGKILLRKQGIDGDNDPYFEGD